MPNKRDRSFLEAVLQNMEAAIDLATENEAVKAIPVIGTAFKVCQGLDDLRSRAFAAKLSRFVSDPHLRTEASSAKIKRKVQENPEEAIEIGEALFLVLDRLIDLDKPAVLAKVYVAYLDDLLKPDELKRIAQAVDHAFGEDLKAFLEADQLHLHDESQPWMPLLEPAGLTSSTVDRAPPGLARASRSVTRIGHALWNAWRHEPREP
jgi:hypothetical protein